MIIFSFTKGHGVAVVHNPKKCHCNLKWRLLKHIAQKCDKETVHIIWTEDAYGASGVARIFSTLLSVGMSNLACTTYSKCISCGNTKEL